MKPLSKKQQVILDFLGDYIREKGFPPSVREIMDAVGLKSPSTVHTHLNTLEKRGYIVREAGKTRAIRLVGEPEEEDGVPILGTVAAGQPILAVEDALGYLPYNAGDSGEYFALRIKGNSMVEAGILEDDMVVVRSQDTAHSGEIVIARIGDEATCKRLLIEDGEVWLMPENADYDPIDGRESHILGRVTAVIRTY